MLSFFPRGVLDEILNLIESVSEDFPSYSCSYSSLYLSNFYPVIYVFVFRLFRIHVTVFFATYLLLLLFSSALLKQCSGAIVRLSDSSS